MKIFSYLREVRDELKKVIWPTRKAAFNMTLVVIGASIAVGLYIGGLDLVFTTLLGHLVK